MNTLFDELDDEQQLGTSEQLPTHKAPNVRLPSPDAAEESGPPPLQPEYQFLEVSVAVYESWSYEMQLTYLIARDEDAALREENSEEAQRFYLARAEAYRCMRAALKKQA